MTKKEKLLGFLAELRESGITYKNVTAQDVREWHVHVSYNNGKVKDPCIDMIAGITCDPNLPCYAACYARHGHMAIPYNKALRLMNLMIWKADPERYEREIQPVLMAANYARFNADGDMPDAEYLRMVRRVGGNARDCRIWFMSKKDWMVNAEIAERGMFPKNMKPMLSAWGKFQPQNPHNLSVFHVRLKTGEGAEFIPKDAWPCPGNCDICKKMKRGCPYGETVFIDQHR